MKIIAGKYRNRAIPTLKSLDYRPSTTKFREALFSILSSGEFQDSNAVIGAKVLDLFSGTGILSFEALSRGAFSVMLVDNKIDHLKLARDFSQTISDTKQVKTLLLDVMRLPRSIDQYNLVFMDPPYYKDYVVKALNILIERDYLSNGAIIAIEMESRGEFELPSAMQLIKKKVYGNNKLILLRYEQS